MADDNRPFPASDPPSSSESSPEPIDMLRPLFREEPLPPEGGEPPQLWLWMLIFGVLLFCVLYLGLYVGDFGPDPWLQTPDPVAQSGGPPVDAAVSGSQVYNARCASCHQSDGQGISGVFPPLVGASWVENKGQIIRILLHGMQGEMTVRGEVYNGIMPAWGNILSDAEIAAVITHVRSAWDNDYGEVTTEEVAAVRSATDGRSAPWEAEELQQDDNQTVPVSGDAAATHRTTGQRLYDQIVAARSLTP